MTVSNPSFERDGFGPGRAEDWAVTADSGVYDVAEFGVESLVRIYPTSESSLNITAWNPGKYTYEVSINETVHAVDGIAYNGVSQRGYGWEGFERGWSLNQNDIFTLLASLIDAFVLDEEDFEENWGCLWYGTETTTTVYSAGNIREVTISEQLAISELLGLDDIEPEITSESTRFVDLVDPGPPPKYLYRIEINETMRITESLEINDKLVFRPMYSTDFDFVYPNEEKKKLSWLTHGFLDNFDALVKTNAIFDISPPENVEDFEDESNNTFNRDAGDELTDRIKIYSLAPFIISSFYSTDAIAFRITENINDRISLRWTDNGTAHDLNVALDHGSYSTATMVDEINTKVRAALDADPGNADASDFTASVSSVGRIRLETSFAGVFAGDEPQMELVEPASDSAWPMLGFITGEKSRRKLETYTQDSASFDVGTPEDVDDFEEEWRDNETHIADPSNPYDPDDATFQSNTFDNAEFDTANDDYEDFESEWTLTL
jgi:hypothetical protein